MVLLSPKEAKAGFFLFSVFSNQVFAETSTPLPPEANDNSQTMSLLQASVLSVPVKEDPKARDSTQVNQNTDISIVSDNALVPAAGPTSGSGGPEILNPSFNQVSVYVVRSGDTLSQVAEMFDITVDTILSANDMKKGDKLKEGDVLLILPFSGIEHTVAKGQTLQGIANIYKVDIDEILLNNDIDADAKLAIGDKLMIPGASIPNEPVKSSGSATTKISPYSSASLKNIVGYFVNPVPTGRRTQNISSKHRGIDIGAPTGSPIYASAAGRVKFARTGYNGGFGTLVIVSHSNGTETLYAHMSKLGTSVGAQVGQGEIIGYVGSTGRSTGPHLHFEVHGAKNPGTDWSWAK